MNVLKYSGPLLALFAVLVLLLFSKVYQTSDNLVFAWVLWSALSVSVVLPLLGLGVGFALVPLRFVFISSIAFFMGFFMALANYDKVWFLFTNSPNAEQHLYLTLPIMNLFSGILLLLLKKIIKYLVIPFSFVIAFMLAITTKLTDPTLHDPIITLLALLIAIWIILVAMLSVRSFYRQWFIIAIRIFASWLLASSLLYGGTLLAVKYGYFTPKSNSFESSSKIESSFDDVIIPDFETKGTNP